MKITCQACAAKYTIADEKVVGKTVKIRCKRCGANIIVNAGDGFGAATSPAMADSRLASSANDDARSGDSGAGWMVNVAETDQRTMSVAEIVAEYGNRVVTDETFCWKDGMGDWLPLRDIPELYAACTSGGSQRQTENAAARVHEAPSAAAGPGNGSAAAAMVAPVARRAAAARAPSADLFGNAAQAGGEDEVLTSAPAGAPQRHEDAKPIGARNENSVLFSLGALTAPAARGGGAAESKTTATSEASGLIDIRQLSAQLADREDKKKQSRVDDIMNLGGGAFGPTLAAPILSAPPLDEFVGRATGSGGSRALGKSTRIVFLALGSGAVLIIAGVLGVTALVMDKKPTDKTHATNASAAEAMPSASVAAAPVVAASVQAVAVAAAAAAVSTETPPPSLVPSAAASGTAGSKEATNPAPTETTHAEHPEKEVATEKRPAAPPPGAAAGPFDMTEARTRLGAIAGAVQSCKRGDVSGTGHVIVTFATSGAAVTATINGPPFEGTPAGACVASKFRGARVPPFSGAPLTVSKSFTIN